MGKKGKVFYGRPTIDDHVRLKVYESIYWVGSISIIMGILISTIMVIMYIGEGESVLNSILIGLLVMGIMIGNMIFIVGAFFVIGNLTKFTQRKKWDDDPPAVTKVTDTHVIVEIREWDDKKIMNRFPLKLIKDTKGDPLKVIKRRGLKVPFWYKPFRQAAPDPDQSHTFLYYKPSKSTVPLDHLVLLEFSVKCPVRYKKSGKFREDPESKGFFGKMIYRIEEGEIPSKDAIISIRPEEQKDFHTLVKFNRENLKGAMRPSQLEGPPE